MGPVSLPGVGKTLAQRAASGTKAAPPVSPHPIFAKLKIAVVVPRKTVNHQVLGQMQGAQGPSADAWVSRMKAHAGDRAALQAAWPSTSDRGVIWAMEGAWFAPESRRAPKVSMKLRPGYVLVDDRSLPKLATLSERFASQSKVAEAVPAMSTEQAELIGRLGWGTPKDLAFYEHYRVAGFFDSKNGFIKLVNLHALESAVVKLPAKGGVSRDLVLL